MDVDAAVPDDTGPPAPVSIWPVASPNCITPQQQQPVCFKAVPAAGSCRPGKAQSQRQQQSRAQGRQQRTSSTASAAPAAVTAKGKVPRGKQPPVQQLQPGHAEGPKRPWLAAFLVDTEPSVTQRARKAEAPSTEGDQPPAPCTAPLAASEAAAQDVDAAAATPASAVE